MGKDNQPQLKNNENDWALGDFISSGQTWRTYIDPMNTEKVIKVSIQPTQEHGLRHGELIASMLHLMFPENIPQIFEVGLRSDGKRQIRVSRSSFHHGYARMTELRNKSFLTEAEAEAEAEAEERSDLLRAHDNWVRRSDQSQTLLQSLEAMGIQYDDLTATNIVRDARDKAVYVDDLNIGFSWNEVKSRLKKYVDEAKQEQLDKLIMLYESLPPEEDNSLDY